MFPESGLILEAVNYPYSISDSIDHIIIQEFPLDSQKNILANEHGSNSNLEPIQGYHLNRGCSIDILYFSPVVKAEWISEGNIIHALYSFFL